MSAIISPCGQYRYRLERDVQMDGLTFAYFGVNPSTADATIDDATVRKWIGFTKVNGGRRFIVGNVFAYRSTDVNALGHADNPIGLQNNAHLMLIAEAADILVPCWGDRSKVAPALRRRFDDVLAMLCEFDKPVMTFGLTKGGDPKHPLMLGYRTPLVEWHPNEKNPRTRRG
jgi:hypothetical protein